MDRQTILLNLGLAIILFFGNGFLGKIKSRTKGYFGYDTFGFTKVNDSNFADHFFQKIVHPAILIAISAAILQNCNQDTIARDLWLVVPFYWMLRLLYIFLWNIVVFTNWNYELLSMVISILLGEFTLFYIIRPLIDSGENVFIDAPAFRDAFWFAAITYITKLVWDISKASLLGYSVFPEKKRTQVIASRYYKFKWKYGAEIDIILRNLYYFKDDNAKNCFLCLIYAIMIYEDHCRPKAVRCIEYVKKAFQWNSIMSLGIMQVQSPRIISDRTSIKLAIDKLYKTFSCTSGLIRKKFDAAVLDYNPSNQYRSEVYYIFSILCSNLGIDIYI